MQDKSRMGVRLTGAEASFHAHHSPVGAFGSFTCGLAGARGGLGFELGKPANQDIYVGVQRGSQEGSAEIVCLPFFVGSEDAAARYLVEQTNAPQKGSGVLAFPLDRMTRDYGFGSDRFSVEGLEFALYTPVEPLPDPASATRGALRDALLPAVIATLTLDNTGGTEAITAFFALAFEESGIEFLNGEEHRGRVGFTWRDKLGVLGESSDGPEPFLFSRFSLPDGLRGRGAPHRLGTVPGIGFTVPPGKRRTLTLALGWYLAGKVTTRVETSYLYASHYASLRDVLTHALDRANELRESARRFDAFGASRSLSADRQFLMAHAIRSYQGSTQLLELKGRPLWVVNEGEYCMLNTLDLTVDHVFWELAQNPWVVKNTLDTFARWYSYTDQCGVSFCHDMGVHNSFSPPETSSYELSGLTGCFSFMTQEELCNWVLTGACYWAKTADGGWLLQHRALLQRCLTSMIARADQHGIMTVDSSRCAGGSEITTYDSLDASLGQARNNLYLALKCWATYLALALLGIEREACLERASALGNAVAARALPSGLLPAVFEADSKGYSARILPASEALVYPMYWARHARSAVAETARAWLSRDGRFGALLRAIDAHISAALDDPEQRNVFPDGGIRLSSTSDNSWMSKIAIFQHVAERELELDPSVSVSALFQRADRAHAVWQRRGSAQFACSDQFLCGVAEGSRYYPRCVTTWLWIDAASQ
jgi:hypothetical protein